MLTKEQIAKLLNRPLTTAETNNFSLYLKIATDQMSTLLCMDLTCESGVRAYPVRSGYRTIFTAPFTGTPTVTVDGLAKDADTYSVRQFDNLNGTWYNSIVFKQHLARTAEQVEVTADWGFDCLPVDLQVLLADLFNDVTNSQNADLRVQSKQIEDFRVTYKDISNFEATKMKHSTVISKYSLCNGVVRHGRVCSIY